MAVFTNDIKISCILAVKNGAVYLKECFESLLNQKTSTKYEICVYDDGSEDETPKIISSFTSLFFKCGVKFTTQRGESSRGVGFAKNQAVRLSTGNFLCFCDADDVNMTNRLQSLYDFSLKLDEQDNCIIGSNFDRIPNGSTQRYTQWACSLSDTQLYTQMYTSFGPTVLAPTWFLSRKLYDRLCGFKESCEIGFPEDLDFFYAAIRQNAKIYKLNEKLVMYRYHAQNSTLFVTEHIIWNMRIFELEHNVLCHWKTFTIWNAGKQGKKFFRSLTLENQQKIVGMCDVDKKKIARGKFEVYDNQLRKMTFSIPIINYRNSQPPIIICIKLFMTNGVFEKYLAEMGWKEGIDFFHFN